MAKKMKAKSSELLRAQRELREAAITYSKAFIDGSDATCESCGGGGWVHIDLEHVDAPDGVYNCDCPFGQSITHAYAMERHAAQCGCAEYGLPKSDEERDQAFDDELRKSKETCTT